MDDDYFICPHCGAEVALAADACPECGSDDETGWSETAEEDALDLPFDDDETEGHSAPFNLAGAFWKAIALLLLGLFVIGLLLGLY